MVWVVIVVRTTLTDKTLRDRLVLFNQEEISMKLTTRVPTIRHFTIVIEPDEIEIPLPAANEEPEVSAYNA